MVEKTRTGENKLSARAEILKRIQSATRVEPTNESSYSAIFRAYQQAGRLSLEQKLDLFINRLLEYDAQVQRCSPQNIAQSTKGALNARAKKRLIVPPGFPQS